VFEESLAEVLHGTGGEGANKNETDEGCHRCGSAAGRRSEEGLDSGRDVGGHDAEGSGGSGGSVSMHEQGGAGQGSGGEGSFGDRYGGVFVGPALDAMGDGARSGREQGIDGSGEIGGENPPGVAVAEVGGLMCQDHSALDRFEGVKETGGDHDAASGLGGREGIEVVGLDQDDRAVAG
jgi:hypothetical protein